VTYSGIFILVGFALTRTVFDAAVRRWGNKWGVRGIADPAGLPLLVLDFEYVTFRRHPASQYRGPRNRARSRRFRLNTSREPDGMAQAATEARTYRKLNPTRLRNSSLRSSKRRARHPDGDGLESGKSAAGDQQPLNFSNIR